MFVLDTVDLFWWSEPPVVVADTLFNCVGGSEVGVPSDTGWLGSISTSTWNFGVTQNVDFAIFVVSNSRKNPIWIDEIRFLIAVSTPRSRIKSTYLKMDLLGRSTHNHRKWRN